MIRNRMEQPQRLRLIPPLERATHAVALALDGALGDLGVGQAEAHVLAHLAHAGTCSINDLHAGFGHKRSTLTSVLDRLERRGWVRRGPHPVSRRLVQVRLTGEGQRVAERVSAVLRAHEGRVLARTSEADVAAFLRVIKALEECIR